MIGWQVGQVFDLPISELLAVPWAEPDQGVRRGPGGPPHYVEQEEGE